MEHPEGPTRPHDIAGAGRTSSPGLYLFGVVRARSGARAAPSTLHSTGPRIVATTEGDASAGAAAPARIRFRELEALVRPSPYRLPALDRADLVAHQRIVERTMRSESILPLPPGVVFRGRAPLLGFLADQYASLEQALALVEGRWEFRLHIGGALTGRPASSVQRAAGLAFDELRRLSRASVPFRHGDGRLVSAAFLVERERWIGFVERVEELGTAHPALGLDVTGPWPPYDFVRLAA